MVTKLKKLYHFMILLFKKELILLNKKNDKKQESFVKQM